MPGYGTNGKNTMLDALGTAAGFVGLATSAADPGTGATSAGTEVSGGSPAYARKAITWNAASGGTKTSNGTVTFDVPAATVAYFTLHSAATAGTYYGSGSLSASEVFAAQGQYQLTSVTLSIT